MTDLVSEYCPYGQPCNRLWVRETWRPVGPWECREDKATVQYKADGQYIRQTGWPSDFRIKTSDSPDKWRPSIFLPRWASRITLEITGVRVERLQDISETDAIAEGCGQSSWPRYITIGRENELVFNAREAFRYLWDTINGKTHPWQSNPWVWVVEFKRLEREAAQGGNIR